MAGHSCFICASDERLFLDTTNSKEIGQWVETCLDAKIKATDRVCHKCAFELDKCSSFLRKYEQTRKLERNNKKECILCHRTTKKVSIFDLSKDTDFQQTSFKKLQKALNDELEMPIEDFKLICIFCLYTVDVLLDLRNIYKKATTYAKNNTNKKINYATFPKIETAIASRKTTKTEPYNVSLETLDGKMRHTRSQVKKENDAKLQRNESRRCDVCNGFIDLLGASGKVTRKVNSTCLTCQNKNKKSLKRTRSTEKQIISGTRDCTVYLKDVLKERDEAKEQVSDAPKKKKEVKKLQNSSNDTDSSSAPLRTRLKRRNVESPLKSTDNKRTTRQTRATSVPLSNTEADEKRDLSRTGRKLRKTGENGKSLSVEHTLMTRKRRRVISISSESEDQDESKTKKSRSLEEVSKDKEDIFKTETYICDECGASYENKLISLTHKLLHYKQPKLQLHKLNPENLVKGATDASKVNDHIEEPSENINIVLDDDEDEVVAPGSKSADNESNVNDEIKNVSEDDNPDIRLVIRDSDEEQNLKSNEVETQGHTSLVEDVEKSVSGSPIEDKSKETGDERKSNEADENNSDKVELEKSLEEADDVNENSKEEQGIINGHIDDVDHEKKEETRGESNEKDTEIEPALKEQGKEDGQAEKEKEEEEEKEKDAIEDINNSENKEEKEEMVEAAQENSSKSRKSIDDLTVVEEDSPKESNEDDSEIKELENGIVEQSSLMDTSTTDSFKLDDEKEKLTEANVTEVCDSDSQDLVVSKNDEPKIAKSEDNVVVVEDTKEEREKSTNDSENAAAEVLQEVLDLASAEFQKRLENMNTNNENDTVEAETLENISREVNNGVDTFGSEGTVNRSPSLVE